MEAADVMELPKDEQKELIDIVASVLHLGNVVFGVDELAKAVVIDNEHLQAVSEVNLVLILLRKYRLKISLDSWRSRRQTQTFFNASHD